MKIAIWVIVGILLFLLLLLLAVCGVMFNMVVWRKMLPLPDSIAALIAGNGGEQGAFERDHEKAEAAFLQLPQEVVTLHTPDGARLFGRVLRPQKPNGRTMLLCHGARSSGKGEYCFMAPALLAAGYALVIPDHRGCGESDGKYMGYGTHESKDTFLWVDYAKAHFPENRLYLLGISMGAATVLMMSAHAEDPAIRGIIADCPYTSAWEEFSYQMHASFHLPDFPILPLCDLYCRLFCGYRFRDASPLEAVKQAKKPILFIHGDADDFVPTFMQDILYDACQAPKEKLTVAGAVHARSYYQNPNAYQSAVRAFIERCESEAWQ